MWKEEESLWSSLLAWCMGLLIRERHGGLRPAIVVMLGGGVRAGEKEDSQ